MLLDTNIFRDASSKPSVFRSFFKQLKDGDVTLATIDIVKYELLKGSADNIKYKTKETFIEEITDTVIPTIPKTFELAYELIKKYKIDGTALEVSDLFLGAMLKQYGENIYLLTRDTTDFLQNIFNLEFILNLPHGKGIHTYGIYQYK